MYVLIITPAAVHSFTLYRSLSLSLSPLDVVVSRCCVLVMLVFLIVAMCQSLLMLVIAHVYSCRLPLKCGTLARALCPCCRAQIRIFARSTCRWRQLCPCRLVCQAVCRRQRVPRARWVAPQIWLAYCRTQRIVAIPNCWQGHGRTRPSASRKVQGIACAAHRTAWTDDLHRYRHSWRRPRSCWRWRRARTSRWPFCTITMSTTLNRWPRRSQSVAPHASPRPSRALHISIHLSCSAVTPSHPACVSSIPIDSRMSANYNPFICRSQWAPLHRANKWYLCSIRWAHTALSLAIMILVRLETNWNMFKCSLGVL